MKEIFVSELFDIDGSLVAPLFENVKYPFEVIPKIKDFIFDLGLKLDKELFRTCGENIWIAKNARVAESAAITGPCIICENAEIRHCAFIRGSVFIGPRCVVGNSTELKNSVLISNAQVPHYNYVGDSVLGNYSHLGAGAITSNVKSDKSLVNVKFNDEVIKTGLKKFGALVGDCVEVGCGCVLNPGTIIGKGSNIYPLSSVRGVVAANSIYKRAGEVVSKL